MFERGRFTFAHSQSPLPICIETELIVDRKENERSFFTQLRLFLVLRENYLCLCCFNSLTFAATLLLVLHFKAGCDIVNYNIEGIILKNKKVLLHSTT